MKSTNKRDSAKKTASAGVPLTVKTDVTAEAASEKQDVVKLDQRMAVKSSLIFASRRVWPD